MDPSTRPTCSLHAASAPYSAAMTRGSLLHACTCVQQLQLLVVASRRCARLAKNRYSTRLLLPPAASARVETLLKAFLGGSGYCDCWNKDGRLSMACMRGLCALTRAGAHLLRLSTLCARTGTCTWAQHRMHNKLNIILDHTHQQHNTT